MRLGLWYERLLFHLRKFITLDFVGRLRMILRFCNCLCKGGTINRLIIFEMFPLTVLTNGLCTALVAVYIYTLSVMV